MVFFEISNKMKTELVGTPFIIEQKDGHNYNLDSILLANFIHNISKETLHVYDFGTGQGVLMFYLSLKTNARITGIDIQKSLIDIAQKNIENNQLSHQLSVMTKDIKDLELNHVQMIVSNPPYFKVTKNIPLSDIVSRSIARHEIELTLEALLKKVSQSLKTKGLFYMSYRPDRLSELFILASKYKLAMKELQFIYPYVTKPAHLMLVKMVKDGNDGLKILEPLILYDKKGVMTPKLELIYKGEYHATFNIE